MEEIMLKKLVLPEIIFLIFGFVFGLIILTITPPNLVPDETAHTIRACEISEGHLYNKTPYSNNACYNKLHSAKILPTVNMGIFQGASGYSPINYLASGIGLKIFKHAEPNLMYFAGRFFNFILWLMLTFFAIRITPVFKPQFLFCALLPMNIYMGMSYSADSLSNAFSFLFFAYLFNLIFKDETVQKKDILIVYLLSIIGAFCKGIIYPILLLPLAKYKNCRQKWFITLSALIISFGLLYLWQSINYTNIGIFANYEYNHNILIHKPLIFLGLLGKTLGLNLSGYVRGTIGTLGWAHIEFPIWVYVFTTILFFISFIFMPEKKIKLGHRFAAAGIFIGVVTFIHALMFCTWTAPNSNMITGLQGRYFVQLLPLTFLILGNNIVRIFGINKEIFNIIFVCWSLVLLTLSTILLANPI
jgi:uncharacterized membrane protein